VPYQSTGERRNNPQVGVGRSLWSGAPQAPIPERALDGIPGCLAWLALLFCIASALAFPRVVFTLASLIYAYSAVRFTLAGLSNMRGLKNIKQWEAIDWYTKYQETARIQPDALPWEVVRHLVIIPNYKEPEDILRATLDNLAIQVEALQRMAIVLAMEAAEPNANLKAERLIADYSDKFLAISYSVHPTGLPGELRCKSSNEAWAARYARRWLIDELGWDINHIVVTSMDADTLWHKRYFYALTYGFAVAADRHACFWQAPIRYHGNIWDISPPMRLVNAYGTAFELAYLSAPFWYPLPMSSYSLSFRLLDSSGYWDGDVIADEWHMFIKAFFANHGALRLEPVFLPFLATATTGDTIWDTISSRYQQTLRHAWGSKEVGFIIARMLEHPETPFIDGFKLLTRAMHDILLAGAGWVILTIGSQLPVLFNPGLVPPLLLAYTDPVYLVQLVSGVIVVILGVVFWVQDVGSRPPRPANRPQTFKERLLTLASFPLLVVLTLIFVAMPVLHAQTRLLLGSSLQFQVSRKI
jgi:hypothetical protein